MLRLFCFPARLSALGRKFDDVFQHGRDAHATPSHGLHTELWYQNLSCWFEVARASRPVGLTWHGRLARGLDTFEDLSIYGGAYQVLGPRAARPPNHFNIAASGSLIALAQIS
jgi:hypothetical protein